MQTRMFSLAFGIVYIGIGVLGLIPALYTSPPASAPHLEAAARYGYLFGQFPVNAVHDVFNIVIGFITLLMGARELLARRWAMTLFLLFGLLTILGFIPQANDLWGYMPIFDGDTWFHAGTALVAAYFGYVALEDTNVAPAPAHAH